jgi:Xaa-Pro dipeptidase
MSTLPFFPAEEYEARLRNVRQAMAGRNLDACLISVPENIYYLAGLDHFGFFAYHALIVPREGELVLTARAMERVTVEHQVNRAHFVGYADGADPAQVTIDTLGQMGLAAARLGLEKRSLFLPVRIAEGLTAGLPNVEWTDISGLVDALRQTKSPREQAYARQAAAVSDAMMTAAINTARAGINERDIAVEVQRAMILAGGEPPGFGPFIRSTRRLGEEHCTWTDHALSEGEVLFVELSGCVRRYHAPMGRLIFIGAAPPETHAIEQVCLEAFARVVEAIRPGVKAREVYRVWQDRVDEAGLAHYRRHHCGYLMGIGFPPSWVGGSQVVGLRHDSDVELRPGMTFHLMSWLMGSGRGDYLVSDAALLTEHGCEVLTTIPQHLHVVSGD